MTNYAIGEIVDITIKDARIARKDSTDRIWFTLGETGEGWIPNAGGEASVSVERVAPPEWPPRSGDLWRDRNGTLHFAATHVPEYDDKADSEGIDSDGTRVILIAQSTDSSCEASADFYRPANVNENHGPLTLVHREVGAGAALADPTFNPAYRVARCGQQSAHSPHVMEHGPDQPRNCPGGAS